MRLTLKPLAIPRIAPASMLSITSLCLIVGGGLYMIQNLGSQPSTTVQASVPTAHTAINTMELGYPVTLSVPRLDKDVSIKEGYYDPATQQWSLDDSHVFYMQGSVTPIFYGHNKSHLLDKLDELRTGDLLMLKNGEGHTLSFTYRKAKTITPHDTWLLEEKHNNTIMVLSCTGFFFESRQVFYFEYVGTSS